MVSADTDNEATTTATSQTDTDTDTASGNETSDLPTGWPEDWHGDYYLEPDLPLGVELQGGFLVWEGFKNIRLEANTITFEHFTDRLDGEQPEQTFATEPVGDALRVLPPDGEWNVPYFYPGADEVLMRPGIGCASLIVEVHGPPPYDPPLLEQWSRGRLCLLDPYDDSLCCDTWMLDLCPDSISSCNEG